MERHPDVKVQPVPVSFLGSRWGQTVWREGVPEIQLASDLGKIQRRCTLAHEIQHVLRGQPCRPLCPDDEADVIEETARFLLPEIEPVARAVATHGLVDAAEHLRVTRNVLTDRLDAATDDELRQYDALLAELLEPAAGDAACEHVEVSVPRRRHRTRRHDCKQHILRGGHL